MDGSRFDALSRRAGVIDRKRSLKALGGSLAALAITRPLAADAKSSNKTCKKKIDKTCKKQEQACRDYWENFCRGVQECEDFAFPCCDELAKCNASQYFQCITVIPQ